MKSLNKMFLLAAMLFAIAAPCFANGNIYQSAVTSSGIVYSTADSYILQEDITCTTAAGAACIEFYNMTNGNVDIDLHGHYISSNAQALLVDYCTGSVYIHDSVGGGYLESVNKYSSLSIINSATNTGAWVLAYGITMFSKAEVQSTNKSTYHVGNGGIYLEYNSIYSGNWFLVNLDGAYVYGEWIDNRYDSTPDWTGGIDLSDSTNSYIDSVVILGGSGSHGGFSSYTGGNTDDGIVFRCSSGTCSGGTVTNSTINDVYDCGVEWSGHWTAHTVTNNYINRPHQYAFCGYSTWDASLSYSEFGYNQMTKPTTNVANLFKFIGGNVSGRFFNNINFHDNTQDIGNFSGSDFGQYPSDFPAGYSVTLTNNNFRTDNVAFGGTPTDGNGNVCGFSSSIYFTCH